MKTLIVTVFCAIVAVGCNPKPSAASDDYILAAVQNIKFAKHYMSGLCFAFFKNNESMYSKPIVFSAIPCTPAVEALIVNKREMPKPCENKCYKNEKKLQPPASLKLPTSSLGLRGTGRGAGERMERK